MTPKLKKLYKESIKDKLFNKKFKESDSEYLKPNIFSSDIDKGVFTAVYFGWLIARGEFIENNY